MTVFVRGVTRTISAGFNGKVYGPIIWSAAPPASITLVPAADGLTCKATATANAPAGAVVISVSSLDRSGRRIGGSLSVTIDAIVVQPPPPPPTFHFETPSPNDVITDQDAVTVDLTGLRAAGGTPIVNIKGNGKTVPTIIWPNIYGDMLSALPDTPGGGKVWQEVHATGALVILYNCAPGLPLLNPPAAGSGQQTPAGGGDPTPPTAPPGPPPMPAPEFSISARIQADGTVVLDTPIAQYDIQALPDGNFVAMFGTVWSGESAARHLGPHHIDLFDASGAAVLHADLRAHYWNSRVPLRSKPITIARSPAELVAAGLMFPFGDPGVPVTPCANYQYWGAFSAAYAGITVYMPTTGERPDIGLVTDPEGEFMRTGRAGPMLAWAQCGTDFPWFFYDEKAANFLDLTVFPQADCFDLPGYQSDNPYCWKGPRDPKSGYPMFGGGMQPQLAHQATLAYIAGAATKDLTFLSVVQAEAQFAIISSEEASKPDGIVIHGEWRGTAWGHGHLFKAIRLTQDFESRSPLPPRFRSSAYFLELNKSTLKYWSAQMTTDVAIASGVCMEAGATVVGPWQQNYWLMVLAFGMLTGRIEWLPFYLQMLKFTVDMYSGITGFPPGYGTPYYIDLRDDAGVAISDGKTLFANFLLNELRNQKTAADQGASYDPQVTQAQFNALMKDPLNGGVAMVGSDYNQSGRAVMVAADYLDRNGPDWIRGKIRGGRPGFDVALKNIQTMVVAGGGMQPRYSVVAP